MRGSHCKRGSQLLLGARGEEGVGAEVEYAYKITIGGHH